MKKMNITTSVTLALVTLMSSTLLFANSYLPPERIQCAKDASQTLACQGFDREFLMIGSIGGTIDQLPSKKVTLNFMVGHATFNKSVTFVYQSSDSLLTVYLTNASPDVQPDYRKQSHWMEVAPGQFACNSYMTCSLMTV